jgi:hypothetical protein
MEMHETGHSTLAILAARQLCGRPPALSIAAGARDEPAMPLFPSVLGRKRRPCS